MSVGDGIVVSTVLILLTVVFYLVTARKKWRLVGRATAWLVGIMAVVGVVGWPGYRFYSRPRMAEEFLGLHLGMQPVEVTLAKGEPVNKSVPSNEDDHFTMGWVFGPTNGTYSIVRFSGKTADVLRLVSVCEYGGYERLQGFGRYSQEVDIVKALGPPTSASIRKDGLEKIGNYEHLRTAYVMARGAVEGVCLTDDGLEYSEEYDAKATALKPKVVLSVPIPPHK